MSGGQSSTCRAHLIASLAYRHRHTTFLGSFTGITISRSPASYVALAFSGSKGQQKEGAVTYATFSGGDQVKTILVHPQVYDPEVEIISPKNEKPLFG